MRIKVIVKIIGFLLMIFSFTMLVPLVVAFLYEEQATTPFNTAFLVIFLLGLLLWLPVHRCQDELRLRDGFMVVTLFWVVLGISGALPFMLAESPHMRFTDAVFESVSGLTTTGATVLTGLDALPRAILFYRQQLQWLGGMGIIVLAVAILPMLRVGGMQLYRAETPGPIKDTKLTPRIAETAKALWIIYVGLTVLCALAYWAAGMSAFDAVAHSFSTIATAGYSTHDASMAWFDSTTIEMIAVLFMVLSAFNFSLHFIALKRRSLKPYFQDREVRAFATIIVIVGLFVLGHLWLKGADDELREDAMESIFQVVSFLTTTGYTTAPYYDWPGFVPMLLIFLSFVGGCGGSTAGGLKVVRVMLIYKQGVREIRRLIHPNAWLPVKIGNRHQEVRVIDAVWGFFSLYIVSFVLIMLVMMEAGLDELSAFSGVAACLNNLGPALGEVAGSFKSTGDPVKWVACFAMLLGRLEVFTLLVLFMPDYWRS
jgi:trk/ktr system potassium uptake protein